MLIQINSLRLVVSSFLRKQAGFSMMELLLWVLILGFSMTMFTRVFFSKKPLQNFTYFMRELDNISMLAQQLAIRGKDIIRLKIHPYQEGGCFCKLEKVLFEKSAENNLLEKIEIIKDMFLATTLEVASNLKVKKVSLESVGIAVEKEEIKSKTNSEIIAEAENKDFDEDDILIHFFPGDGICEQAAFTVSRKDSDGFELVSKIVSNPFLGRFELLKG